ncbi:MAG: hypothetical protein AB7O66_23890 [Limisphaerales bacterium]
MDPDAWVRAVAVAVAVAVADAEAVAVDGDRGLARPENRVPAA